MFSEQQLMVVFSLLLLLTLAVSEIPSDPERDAGRCAAAAATKCATSVSAFDGFDLI